MTKQQKLIGLIGAAIISVAGYAAVSNSHWSNAESLQSNTPATAKLGAASVVKQENIDDLDSKNVGIVVSNEQDSLSQSQSAEENQEDEYYSGVNANTAYVSRVGIEQEAQTDFDSNDGELKESSAPPPSSTSVTSITATSTSVTSITATPDDDLNEDSSTFQNIISRILGGTGVTSTTESTTNSSISTSTTSENIASKVIVATNEIANVSAEANQRPIHIEDDRPTVPSLPGPPTPSTPATSKVFFTSPLPAIGFTSSFTNSANAIVSGTVVLTENLASVTVNGQTVNWRSGTFTANVPLQDGFNTITAVADYGRRSFSVETGVTLDTVKPSAISAVSAGFNVVRLQFNEPMGNDTSTEISNFNIVNSITKTNLPVTSVSFADAEHTAVLLQTGAQNNAAYTLTVNNVKDLAGNTMLEPQPYIVTAPSIAYFTGTAPTSDDIYNCGPDLTLVLSDPLYGVDVLSNDCDRDSLLNHVELQGWPVVIQRTDGSTETFNVSSDPFSSDTDGDGVTDNEEKHGGIDPRNPDTDGDTLTDNQEWNVIYSDPTNQDSDGDGTQDGFEFYSYRTSPVLADTDGDQLSDTDEVIARNRDPRVADLPLHGISVGDIRLKLDQRFTYEDAQGEIVTTDRNSTVTLSQGQSKSRSTTSTLAINAMLATGISRETAATATGVPLAFSEVTFAGGAEFQVSSESSVESQRVREESFSLVRETANSSTVTREIVGARIDADISLVNEGDLAFTISNLEISVMERSRESTRRFFPVATLIANSSIITGEPASFNLGPFTTEHGPILFTSRDIFPSLVDELMQSPSSLVFEIANFDITDEFGRLFTFSNQTARDRSAGIIVDFGDGNIVRNLVSTALQPDGGGPADPMFPHVGGFNGDGSPIGIPIDFALQNILKLTKNASVADGIVAGSNQVANSSATGDDVQLIPPGTTGVSVGSIVIAAGQNGLLDTTAHIDDEVEVTTGYATSISCSADSDKPRALCTTDAQCMDSGLVTPRGTCNGPDVLSRFGSLSTGDFDRQWVVLTNGVVPAGAEFNQLVLKPGKDVFFAFVQDLDEDGLFAREEFLSGSTDSRTDLFDNDSFGNIDIAGYSVGDARFDLIAPIAVPDGIPDSKDTDRDGLGDFAENRLGWKVSADGGLLEQVMPSPRLADSDGDGLLDPQEQDLRIFCFAPFGDGVPVGLPDDGRLDALCSFEGTPVVAQSAAVAIIAGPNGISGSLAVGDDEQIFVQGVKGLTYATEVVGPGANGILDTGLSSDDLYASLESGQLIPPASNPVRSDTDLDGVDDFDELTGFMVGLSIRDGGSSSLPTSQTQAIGDDVQQAVNGGPVFSGGIVILPGPNGSIDSTPGGDDFIDNGVSVVTDPLRRDTDADQVTDGRELAVGGDPRNPDDGDEFRDSDQDGLSDSEETILGWMVAVNGGTSKLVLSNPSRPDSDFDGLPDFAERVLHTDPNNPDTDGDGIRDFDELANFEQFFGLDSQYAEFFVDGASSMQYGTSLLNSDSDNDGLTDHFELLEGYRVLLGGEASFRQVFTNPLVIDTDLDGVSDRDEKEGMVYNQWPYTVTDATDPDTDDDGRSDGVEDIANTDPLVPDVGISVFIDRIVIQNIVDVGGSGGAEFLWYITTHKNNDSPSLLTSGKDLAYSSLPPPLLGFALNGDQDCVGITNIGPGVLTNFVLNKSKSYTLKEGDEVTIRGVLAEADAGSDDCGDAPNYIPTYLLSGCFTDFAETFTFEDFRDGGQASFPFPDGSGTVENCEWTAELGITSN
jgi:hypothetical protein